MLFFERANQIQYDIVEEDKIRRKAAEEFELEKARLLRDAGKGANVNAIAESVMTPGGVAASAFDSTKSQQNAVEQIEKIDEPVQSLSQRLDLNSVFCGDQYYVDRWSKILDQPI